MKLRTIAIITITAVLLSTSTVAVAKLRPGLRGVQAWTATDATHQFSVTIDPYAGVILIPPPGRTQINGSFFMVSAICLDCATGPSPDDCPASPGDGMAKTARVVLEATGNVAAGWGVSDLALTMTTNPSIDYTNGTFEPANALVAGNQVTIDITTEVVDCGMTFSVYFDVCDLPPADPTDPCGVARLVINEILADPNPCCDTDGDLSSEGTDDEFIEIVNISGAALDVSGWTIYDAVPFLRHTFEPGSVIVDGCSGLVLGSSADDPIVGTFGGASVVQRASEGSLGLSNGGDTIFIYNDSGDLEATVAYGTEGGENESLTRDPDVTGGLPLVKHIGATGGPHPASSPGTKIDGSLFTCGDPAPTVQSTTPAASATNVAVDADISITFSEAVTAAAGWFVLECASSGTHAVVESGGSTTFTLNPTVDFSPGEICTVSVIAANVNDIDVDDPFDNMLADYVYTFTTVPADIAPTVQGTTPADLATDVAVGADISITFSESVNVTGGWFTISCDGGAHTAVASPAGPSTSYTLNPDSDFAAGENCTVTVVAANVADIDGTADNMASDYVFSFATAGGGGGSALQIWNLQGEPGNQASSTASSFAANLSAGTLSRGSGVSAASGSNSISSSGWTQLAAIDLSDYYSFTVPVSGGFQVTIEEVVVWVRRSGTGPVNFELRSSADSFTAALATTSIGDNTSYHELTLDFVDLVGQTGTVEFRLYAYDSESGAGSLRISDNTAGDDLTITGSVSAL